MVEFAAVLAEVESRRRDDFRGPFGRRIAPAMLASIGPKACPHDAARAYTDILPAGRKNPPRRAPAPKPDRATLLSEIAVANGDIVSLRALRRRIASRLHPDRAFDTQDSNLLAECNAAIDDAIKACTISRKS